MGNGNVCLLFTLGYACGYHDAIPIASAEQLTSEQFAADKNLYAQEVHFYAYRSRTRARGWDDAASTASMKLVLMQCVRRLNRRCQSR